MFVQIQAVSARSAGVPLPPPRPADLTKEKPAGHSVATQTPPLPPVRPPDLTQPGTSGTQPVVTPPSPDDNDALRAEILASGRIVGKSLASISGENNCGIAAPLELDAVVLSDGSKIALQPPPVLRASLAAAVADWIREEVAPALLTEGERLARIEGVGGYECRTRDRIEGAKLSEHASGDALDLQTFVTDQGERLPVAATGDIVQKQKAFLASVKETACRRFSTVLGPGADVYHAQHLHIDLAIRRNGAHLCQWTMPDEANLVRPCPRER